LHGSGYDEAGDTAARVGPSGNSPAAVYSQHAKRHSDRCPAYDHSLSRSINAPSSVCQRTFSCFAAAVNARLSAGCRACNAMSFSR